MHAPAPAGFVPETRIGTWFLNTQTWSDRVLKVALADLRRMMPAPDAAYAVVLDVGCGHGRSLPLLAEAFRPKRLIGLDHDAAVLANAQGRAAALGAGVALIRGDCARLPLADDSVDLVFCHQTFHHLVDQTASLAELHRVLRPGGLLLFAESTRVYIESWIIRLLFRHPAHAQRSASEYLVMLRDGGFAVASGAVSCPYLWWSRTDLGSARAVAVHPATATWPARGDPAQRRRSQAMLNAVMGRP